MALILDTDLDKNLFKDIAHIEDNELVMNETYIVNGIDIIAKFMCENMNLIGKHQISITSK